VVAKLQQEVAKALTDPAIKAKADAAGLYPATNTPAEFSAFIKTEAERWSKVVAESGMKYD
jgi:tripartite-type tricarboxylate transporter receptor subunit TctC